MNLYEIRLSAGACFGIKGPLLVLVELGTPDKVVSDQIVDKANYDGMARGNSSEENGGAERLEWEKKEVGC